MPLAAASTLPSSLNGSTGGESWTSMRASGCPASFSPHRCLRWRQRPAFAHEPRVRRASTGLATSVFAPLIATGTRTAVVLLAAVPPPPGRRVARPTGPRWRPPTDCRRDDGRDGCRLDRRSDPRRGEISNRIQGIPEAISDPTSDQSYQLRAHAWRASWDQFELTRSSA